MAKSNPFIHILFQTILIVIAVSLCTSAAAQDSRMVTVAVLDLEANGVSVVESRGLSEKLNSHITGIRGQGADGEQYEVIERSQIDRILEQFEIQNIVCSSDSCAVEFGRMLQADRIVIGTVSLIGETYSVTARMVDVESGRSIRSADRQFRGSIDVVLVEVIPAIGTELITGERGLVMADGVVRQSSDADGIAPESLFGIELIPVSGGTFSMGSEDGERDERPVHVVTLDDFVMSVTEITQEQYRTVTGENPASFDSDELRPVESVRWQDAARFCNMLSALAGFDPCYDEDTWICHLSRNGFRLPTEAEWEYACRAGSETAYCGGDDEDALAAVGWYRSNSDDQPHPVGEKEPNAWGLCDMHGNVAEWVQGWYGRYEREAARNPAGPESGSYYVYRGGSWRDRADDCRSTKRTFVPERDRNNRIGFRIVRNPANEPATEDELNPPTRRELRMRN